MELHKIDADDKYAMIATAVSNIGGCGEDLQPIYTEDKSAVIAFAVSRIGGRSENQDSYCWCDTEFGYLVVVCDGMGGGPGGKTASTIAVSEIVAGVIEGNKEEAVSFILRKAVRRANMAIIEAGKQNPALVGMGSTATVLLVSEKSASVAHVGDSRVYQVRDGRKVFRTFDHSMVFQMVAQGVITEEQARLSAQSNIITRALGIKSDVEVDVIELPYEKGDRFVLSTDGIHGAMPERDLLKMIGNKKKALRVVTDDLAAHVDDLGRTNGGGHDNLTVAIVETNTNSKLKSKMSKQTKFTLICLSVLLIISLCLNIFTPSTSSLQEKVRSLEDSTKVMRTELNLKDDTIKEQNAKIIVLEDSVKDLHEKVQSAKDALK